MRQGLLANYSDYLPPALSNVGEAGNAGNVGEAPLMLGEGNTPLIPVHNIVAPAHRIRLFVKYEGLNPTCSFKDRGMVVAVAAAKHAGAKCVICASTGNTSAAAAAYACRAKLPCVVLIPEGKVAVGKIAQAVACGAIIVQIKGNFDDAMCIVKSLSDNRTVAVVNSINPLRLQGQKTAAFEIIEQLGEVPTYHALPVGNAGNITAHWIGYSEKANVQTSVCRYCDGKCPYISAPNPSAPVATRPKMLGYQAAGAAPFANGMPVSNPETIATAIRIGNPQSYHEAQAVLEESGGWVGVVSDEQILQTQKLLAEKEGVFCEPASAASVAGVLQDIADNKIAPDSTVVCTLTGHGLKNPEIFSAPDVKVVELDNLSDFVMNIIDKVTARDG